MLPTKSTVSEGLQFMSPRTSGNYQSTYGMKGSNVQFSKYPALSKHNLNLSSNGSDNPEKSTPRSTNLLMHAIKHNHMTHSRQNTDSTLEANSMVDTSSRAVIELEFQLDGLKNHNTRLKDEYQAKVVRLNIERQTEFSAILDKMQTLNNQIDKDRLKIQSLTEVNSKIESDKDELYEKYSATKQDLEESNIKAGQVNKQFQKLKDEVMKDKVEISELSKRLQVTDIELSSALTKFKNSEERYIEMKGKEDHWKNLVMTMSQQKTLLNNRISQLLQQQAKLENVEVAYRLQPNNKAQVDKSNKQMTQEIVYLKNRINEILNQQETSSLKVLYQQKIMSMQKEIQQLKSRYLSPETVSHDKNEQQWKGIVEQKNRQINQLKTVSANLQAKITHLNKEIQAEHSKNSTTAISSESQLDTLKTVIKSQQRALQASDQKLKYLVVESRKKDDFLRQYLSASVNTGDEMSFVENFFKSYQIEIPVQGFSSVCLKQIKVIDELKDRVEYLSSKLYDRK